ncbi:MAG: hypothetical protein HXS50_02370 [Theionarchaea archaeon]|nr:hypothetical protein [Theionarchaea archaeon]
MLSSWERVTRELLHEEPDRVPWGGEGVSMPTADIILGRPALTGMGGRRRILELQSRGKHAEARSRIRADILDLAKKLKIDLVQVINLPPMEGEKPTILSEREWTYDGQKNLRTIEGNLLTIEVEAGTGRRIKYGLEDLEDLISGIETGVQEAEASATEAFDDLSSLVKTIKDDLEAAVIYPTWNCFLTHPDWLPTFLRAFHTHPDLILRFERVQSRKAIAAGKAAIDAGVDVIGIGGDLAYKKGPMISPDKYHRFILPFMRKASEAFHRKGAYSMIASDGNLMPIAQDYFIESRVDAVREIEPGPMDRVVVKENFGHRVCLNGNVDCGRTLGLSSPDEVARETKQNIELWSPGGGHIISSSNTISPNVRPENFLSMWRAIFRYGNNARIR